MSGCKGHCRRAAALATVILGLLASSPARPADAASGDPLQWLEGRWVRPFNDGRWEMTWTAVDGGWRGVIHQIAASKKPQLWGTYEIAPSRAAPGGYRLVLTEGTSRTIFSRSFLSGEHLRFESPRTQRLRHAMEVRRLQPGDPFAVNIRIVRGQLFVGQFLGPQHGAAVPIDFWFERMPPD